MISERFPLLILKISVYSDLLSMTRIKRVNVLKGAECYSYNNRCLAVGISDEPGGLSVVMNTLYNNAISVEYMYAFVSKSEDIAYVILRVADNQRAADVLTSAGIKLY